MPRDNEKLGEGDTELFLDVLPAELAEVAFEKLRTEVRWNVMRHRGSYICKLLEVGLMYDVMQAAMFHDSLRSKAK